MRRPASKKIAMCIGCHGIVGYQASFPEVYKVPMISGQSANYISAALHAYQKGERKHPTMRAIADSLTEQDIADVSAYYAQHGKTDAPAGRPSPRASPACRWPSCSRRAPACPATATTSPSRSTRRTRKLAGQHADYLFVALKSYKVEKNANVGRGNAVMGGIAKQFSNAELKALASYISSVQGDLKMVPESRFR